MSEESNGAEPNDSTALGTRWPEVGVAVFLLAIGALVITDSLRVGTGWADDGPRSGYFPFYIGLLLMLASGTVLVTALLGWHKTNPVFAQRSQLASVLAVGVPMVMYVGLIALVGIYLASLVLIGYFMRRHGKFGCVATVVVSVGVPLLFFMVFERWFLVPLPKGPIEGWLGF